MSNASSDSRSALIGIRKQFGASQCARLLRVDSPKIFRWSGTAEIPVDKQSQIADLALIGRIFEDANQGAIARRWLNAMNPELRYETPAEEILSGRWIAAISAARSYVNADLPGRSSD